jgi:hypothetical protein
MKQAYFFRLTVTKAEITHTLLIPIESKQDVDAVTKAWRACDWIPDVDLTPFPGQGINASDLGVTNG